MKLSLKRASGIFFTLAAVVFFSFAIYAADSLNEQVFQIRRVADKASADTEAMALTHQAGANAMKETETLQVEKKVLMNRSSVKLAKVTIDPALKQPQIEINFTEEGTKTFAKVTRENIEKRLAIVIDGKLYTAPVVKTEIPGGQAVISGTFSKEEAQMLTDKINGASVEVVY